MTDLTASTASRRALLRRRDGHRNDHPGDAESDDGVGLLEADDSSTAVSTSTT
ncbi:hypothetical protein [Raineyella antarctica]|uniref:hypothetical protein n=1 Tax=Raineyella antarctica TaxID=1577474 RepID=UPI00158816FB|nr:hypothetical protein [Raineyella antarctica]